MNLLNVVYCGLVLLCTSSPRTNDPPRTIVIENDRGGLVDDYITRFDYLKKIKAKVIIKGACISACTFLMTLPGICAAKDSEFWFHGAYLPDGTLVPHSDIEWARTYTTPRAFALQMAYKTPWRGFTKKRPYEIKMITKDMSVVYLPVLDPSHHAAFQSFLVVEADHLIPPCSGVTDRATGLQ